MRRGGAGGGGRRRKRERRKAEQEGASEGWTEKESARDWESLVRYLAEVIDRGWQRENGGGTFARDGERYREREREREREKDKGARDVGW